MNFLFPYIYERYLAKQIYAAFGFILFALVALFLFFDVLAELGSVNQQYTLLLALGHVLLKAPIRVVEIIPIAGLIGSIYVFAMLASQSEFTILRIAGLDIRRGLVMLGKISLPIVAVTLLLSEWVGPMAESFSERVKMKALRAPLFPRSFVQGCGSKTSFAMRRALDPFAPVCATSILEKLNRTSRYGRFACMSLMMPTACCRFAMLSRVALMKLVRGSSIM